MTEYGRGYNSEPWHPEDPLYGDQGSYGGHAQGSPWGGRGTAPAPPRYDGGWDGTASGGAPYDPYGTQQPHDPLTGPYTDPYAAPAGYPPPHEPQGYAQNPGGPYDQGPYEQYPQDRPYPGEPQYPGYPQDQGYAGQPGYPQEPQYPYDPGYPQDPAYGDPHAQPHPHAQPYPPHEQGPVPQAAPRTDGPEDDWQRDGGREPDPDHAFFADDPADDRPDADDEDDRATDDRSGHESRGKKTKRRGGCARFFIAVVIAAGVGGAGYVGYRFYESRIASPPDFAGEGSGALQVEIPDGAPLQQMGQILKKEGVVKSVDAFTAAAGENPKGSGLQPGSYSMRLRMSAASAVELMLDPKSRNGLTVQEGLRAGAVYDLIDKKLRVKSGTTKAAAEKNLKQLGLPSWANDSSEIKDPLEGFLYPSTYNVGGHATPTDVLKQMVSRAGQEYARYNMVANAKKYHLDSPLQLLSVASLTQAEGMTHEDFRKMAAVIYNRLDPSNAGVTPKLEFDSTYNYLKNQSKINIGIGEIRSYNDPYNTYFYRGLPPGPIGNPGADALKAAIDPDNSQKWLFFISVDGKKTDFSTNLTDHNKLVQQFNERQRAAKQNG
ncbi:endolytic transglycosylase MltG [Streptomyces catenulae]|uniref:Endolytic murein transglycosylase n=1 Tax=Streptomyces catenulae TaxID=66875 RepID=A0ABV2YWB7_9ACTN|nr:endolytic transglycosylase MltG [Streptomyces catenulae]